MINLEKIKSPRELIEIYSPPLKRRGSELWNVLCKKNVLKNFAKFTKKHLFQSPFFIKLRAVSLYRAPGKL